MEQVDRAKTQLFNNISHEFRTPLSIILGQAEKLGDATIGQTEQQEGLKQINQQIDTLNEMLNEMMDLSKLQMGALKHTPKLVIWEDFVSRIFAMFDGLARKKQLDYRLEVLSAEETYLWLGIEKMERILVNLIGNAIKFTPEIGRILVRSQLKDGVVEVLVSDTGPGIPPEEQEAIFERYWQGSTAQGNAQPGYGIGLALCREYVNVMNGRLWVESIPGRGASFFLHLPLKAAAVEDLPQQPAADEHTTAAARIFARVNDKAAGGHILIVEDHPVLQLFLRKTLESEHRISTADNGEQAW